jgi:hypothetical protein
MGLAPSIFFGKVMHHRLLPKVNAFTYRIYYLLFPLSCLKTLPLAYNRFSYLSFYDRDHGCCDGSSLESWAKGILNEYHVSNVNGDILLMAMPRVLGYVFNPVSFWFCHDQNKNLIAVLCEVHNTFGERHTYLCVNPDHRPIEAEDYLTAEKLFHVSPFLKREGHYVFRFDFKNNQCNIEINFYNENEELQLLTSLRGQISLMNTASLLKAFWAYPLVTVKAIFLIHWQALKLILKGISYIPKPKQNKDKVSISHKLNKK